MNHTRWLALAASLLAWNCGTADPALPESPSPTASPSPAPVTAAFVYVTHGDGRQAGIAAYRVDLDTGALDEVMDTPLVVPGGIAADPGGRFLYALDNGTDSFPVKARVIAYRIGSSGTLDEIGRAAIPEGWSKPARLLGVSDRFVYALVNDSSTGYAVAIVAYRSGETGEPALAGFAGAGISCCLEFFTLHPAGHSAYMDSGGSGRTVAYRANADGTLSRSGEAPAPANPVAGLVHPSGRWLLMAGGSEASAYVASYAIGPGTVNGPTALAATGEVSPRRMAIEPHGRFVYVAGTSHAAGFEGVLGYGVDAGSGALRELPSRISMEAPRALAVDPTGRFLFVTTNNVDVRTYAIDPDSGALRDTGLAARPGVDPADIAVVAVR